MTSNGHSPDNLYTGKLVLGTPLKAGDTTLVPVISVTAGFTKLPGAGTGGGGFMLNPVAVVAVQNDKTHVYSLQSCYPVEEISKIIGELNQKGGPVL